MFRICTILLLLLVGRSSVAQQSYQPGYVVLNSGDTLQGYLYYNTARWGKSTLRFRPDRKSPVQRYSPGDISGYGFPGDLTFGSGTLPDRGDEKFFYQRLIEGPVRLLFVQDSPLQKEWYLLSEEKGDFNLSKGRVGAPRSVEDIRKNHTYRGYIRAVVGSCQNTWHLIEKASLSASDLVEILQVYYDCIGENYTSYYVPRGTFNYRLSLHGGMTYNQLSFNANPQAGAIVQPDYLPELNFNSDWQPTIGAEIEFYRIQSIRWWTVMIGLYYQRAQFDGVAAFDFNENQYRYQFASTYSTVQLPAGIRFYKQIGEASFFAEAGGFINYFLSHDIQYSYDRIQNNEVFPAQGMIEAEERVSYGLWGAAGAMIPRTPLVIKVRGTFLPDFLPEHFPVNAAQQLSLSGSVGWIFYK